MKNPKRTGIKPARKQRTKLILDFPGPYCIIDLVWKDNGKVVMNLNLIKPNEAVVEDLNVFYRNI